VRSLAEIVDPRRLTIAGGVTSVEEVAALDRIGCRAQVGMALYEGVMGLADAIVAPMRSDRDDRLWPTVVCDERGVCLGLAYSSAESVREAVRTLRGVYYSRSRGGLWIKGESSGSTQELLRIDADCDRDTLRFTVRQHGHGFCHTGTRTCFGDADAFSMLAGAIDERMVEAPAGSYTRRLLDDVALLRAKLVEEAGELADATEPGHVAMEAADVIYFAMVRMRRADVSMHDVERELMRRALRVTRRRGDAKVGGKLDPSGGGASS
jgi:phosphoribosyl-ATP pyrophosphohydrolase